MDAGSFLASIDRAVPLFQERAATLDEHARFPAEDIAQLRAVGALHAPVPRHLGGLGIGTEPSKAPDALQLFRLLGQGNLALGRLIEAHVNALRLVFRFADAALQRRVAAEVQAGHLAGLWVTDPPGETVRDGGDGSVTGARMFCSGAGHVSRAVITAAGPDGALRLAWATIDGSAAIQPLPGGLAGMRAATTGQVRFDRTPAVAFGAPGDYLREPDFSCGAWRTAAATLGGMEALLEQYRLQLRARGRTADPHQQARFGQAQIAVETARLWMGEAAGRAEAADAGAGAVAYVGLARLAVERACLELIALVQRSLGVAALQRGNPAERLSRDLATYLRQPAADIVLTEAAARALDAP